MANQTALAKAELKGNQRELSRLTRPGFAAENDDRVFSDRGSNLVGTLGNRQARIEDRPGEPLAAACQTPL